MIALESELLKHLGFKVDMYPNNVYPEGDYDDVAKKYGVEILEHLTLTQLEKIIDQYIFSRIFQNEQVHFGI